MTAIALGQPGRVSRPVLTIGGLGAAIGLRWAATVSGMADAVAIGLLFGIGLLAVALMGDWRPIPERALSVVLGIAGGAVLVVLAIVTREGPLPAIAQAAAFGPWVAVTILVASAEELVLRGVLFDQLDEGLGVTAAVLITAVLFALMHVPLYGWHVVPLDLGVGLWLAGLRLATGGVAAPGIAHVVADLATWWL
jgi:membrane protease YdiL (CAAX protease family)